MHYPLFFTRRVLLAFIYYNSSANPILQALLSIFLSVFVTLYTYRYRPYSTPSLNYLLIFQELAYTLSLFLTSLFLLSLTKSSIEAIQYIILFTIGSIFLISYGVILKSSHASVKSYNLAKSMRTTVSPEYMTTKIDSSKNFQNVGTHSTGFDFKQHSPAEVSDPMEIIHYVSERNSMENELEVHDLSGYSNRSISLEEPRFQFRVVRRAENEEVEVIDPEDSY